MTSTEPASIASYVTPASSRVVWVMLQPSDSATFVSTCADAVYPTHACIATPQSPHSAAAGAASDAAAEAAIVAAGAAAELSELFTPPPHAATMSPAAANIETIPNCRVASFFICIPLERIDHPMVIHFDAGQRSARKSSAPATGSCLAMLTSAGLTSALSPRLGHAV